MTKPCLPPAYPTKKPLYKAPPLSCDSHTHIFDDLIKYPLSPNRSFTPPEAPVEKLLGMLDVLGIDRAVIVHSSAYGPHNAATLKAVKSNPKRLRGVAVTGPDTPVAEIEELNHHGFSGSRLSTVVKGTPGFEVLEEIAKRVRPYDWHIAVHVNNSIELTELAPRLMALDMTIVVVILLGSEVMKASIHLALLPCSKCWKQAVAGLSFLLCTAALQKSILAWIWSLIFAS